jgi:hypothetical protein
VLFEKTVPRYVVDFGKEPAVDDDGFRRNAAWWNPPTQRPLADAGAGSVAVLGEPGIGKTTAIAQLVRDASDVNVVRLDEVTDVLVLDHLLAPTLASTGAEDRTLVLDGVDECPLPTKTLVRRLDAALRSVPGTRVVVGCRTADWPETLGASLGAAVGGLAVVELLPLSREDVVELAASRGVDGEAFVEAVVAASAVPLATLPLTLDLLLTLYAADGALPAAAGPLYERGLLLLAADPDPDRAKKPTGTDAQRLAVAQRLAAHLMLCGRSAVTTATSPADTDLPRGMCAGGTEPLPMGEFEVTADLVDGALATALFSGRGPGRLAVVHASFAAYLTARYLVTHTLPEHQLRALLTRTSSLGRTSVPTRLREVAGWLVALDPQRHGWLVDTDPASLVAHGALVSDAATSARLVSYALDAAERDVTLARPRWRLRHPGLGAQLRPALARAVDGGAGEHFGNPVARRARAALQIARLARELDLVPDVARLVEARGLNPYLRASAARCLADLDRDRAVQALRRVLDEVVEHPEHDPDDELRALALRTCWPSALTVEDLVRALARPQKADLIGDYYLFLERLPDELSEGDLERLIRLVATPPGAAGEAPDEVPDEDWVDEDEDDPEPADVNALLLMGTRRGAALTARVVQRALRSPCLPRVLDEVAWLVTSLLTRHRPLSLPLRFGGPGLGEDGATELRRALVLAALKQLEPVRAFYLARYQAAAGGGAAPGTFTTLVREEDLEWLFGLGGSELHEHAVVLVRATFRPFDRAHQECAWRHRGEPIFDSAVAHWFEGVRVDSEAAARMREEWQDAKDETGWEGADEHRALLEAAWARCRAGDASALYEVWARLRVDPKDGDETPLEYEFTRLPGFDLLAPDPAELAAAAQAYLDVTDPTAWGWLDTPASFSSGVVAGYAALAYLARQPQAAALLDALSDDVWRRWVAAVVRYRSGESATTCVTFSSTWRPRVSPTRSPRRACGSWRCGWDRAGPSPRSRSVRCWTATAAGGSTTSSRRCSRRSTRPRRPSTPRARRPTRTPPWAAARSRATTRSSSRRTWRQAATNRR